MVEDAVSVTLQQGKILCKSWRQAETADFVKLFL